METKTTSKVFRRLLWALQGLIVGIGAILPGVSGGTLCYAFGIYTPMLEVLSSPIKGIRKHWQLILFVGLGGAAGFLGFSGITAALLAWNEPVVLCVFIGLILGTVPELWRESGEQGRGKGSFIALGVSFVCIAALFYVVGNVLTLTIPANLLGFAVCGVIWGLSFIVPGFSSSTLLLFFGIYEAMSLGISRLELSVILPLGVAMLVTVLLLARLMRFVFSSFHSVASHAILGFVLATTLMMLLKDCILSTLSLTTAPIYLLCLLCGAGAGFGFTRLSERLSAKTERE